MRIVIGLWIFYRKLLAPALVMSILAGLLGLAVSDSVSLRPIGIAFVFFAPFFHFAIYEIRNPNEYYFYYNLGLSKLVLWISTVLISFGIGLILIVI
jgi:hypothetical protein